MRRFQHVLGHRPLKLGRARSLTPLHRDFLEAEPAVADMEELRSGWVGRVSLQGATKVVRERLMNLATPHANDFLQVVPETEDLRFSDAEFRAVMLFRFGCEFADFAVAAGQPLRQCPQRPLTQMGAGGAREYVAAAARDGLRPCGLPFDPLGLHANSGCKNGEFNPLHRHDLIQRIIVAFLRSAGISCLADDHSLTTQEQLDAYMLRVYGRPDPEEFPAQARTGKHHRPDAIVEMPGGADLVVDVVVGDFRRLATHRGDEDGLDLNQGDPMVVGEAALAAEQEKTNQYKSALRFEQQPNQMSKDHLVAAAITNYGAPGKQLVGLLTKAATHDAQRAATRAAATRGRVAFNARLRARGADDAQRGATAAAVSTRRTSHASWIVKHQMARIGVSLWRCQAGSMLAASASLRGDALGFRGGTTALSDAHSQDLLNGAILSWAAG